jgi:outer membrane protein TolC
LIPQCRQTYEVSLTAYQAGRSEFLTVIDNWRRLLDFELMLHRETADLETTLSELQREVGLQLIRHEIAPETEDQGEQP